MDGRPGRAVRQAAARPHREAIRRGDDVIYQACFFDGTLAGVRGLPAAGGADPGQVAPLGWSYEVADTKLARHAKASALLQICSYVEQLDGDPGRAAGVAARRARAAASTRRRTFRVADYMAYYRAVKRRFEEAVGGRGVTRSTATYPEPVEHCDVCRWDEVCRARRRADDDLSLVAGITARTRVGAQASAASGTRRGLAVLAAAGRPRLAHTRRDALERVREQARIQVEGEDAAASPRHELLEPPTRRTDEGEPRCPDRQGLLALPEPDPATCSSTSRATRSRSTTASTTCSASWSRRAGPGETGSAARSTRSGVATTQRRT